jgi:RNA-directed DNA polymerase
LGVPQGGVISPTIANLVLDGLGSYIRSRLEKRGVYPGITKGVSVVRYADDFVVTTRRVWVANLVQQATEQFLKDRGLCLNLEKTSIKDLRKEPITFLGVTLRWEKQLRILPSFKAIDSIKLKLKSMIKTGRNPLEIIESLNPVIRGWGNAYNFCECDKTFYDLDEYMWELLKKWVWRKHGRV